VSAESRSASTGTGTKPNKVSLPSLGDQSRPSSCQVELFQQPARGLYVNVETLELEYYSQRKMEKDTRWRNITDVFQKSVRAKDENAGAILGHTTPRERRGAAE
jgi:hypothetical protein